MVFDITPMVSQIGAAALGNSLSLYEVSSSAENEEGDQTPSKTEHSLDGVVQVMTAEENEVKVGYLQTGDLIVYVSDNETNIAKLVNGNEIKYEGAVYRIKNVVPNPGHYEVHAKKI